LVKKVNVKAFPYSIPSVGPGADPGVQAVSQLVTVSHPPGGRLPLLSARPNQMPIPKPNPNPDHINPINPINPNHTGGQQRYASVRRTKSSIHVTYGVRKHGRGPVGRAQEGEDPSRCGGPGSTPAVITQCRAPPACIIFIH